MVQVLVMTATVRPPAGMTLLRRADPAVRVADYCRALDFYLRLPGRAVQAVVFAENSGADLAPLRAVARRYATRKAVEFVSFPDGLDYPPQFGKAYGEFRLLDHAFAHSERLQALGPAGVAWKVTGRYRVWNLPRLIATAPARFDLYADVRERHTTWFDMRVFAATAAGYGRVFRGRYPDLSEVGPGGQPRNAEVVAVDLVRAARPDPRLVTRFRVEPLVLGVAAFHDAPYLNRATALRLAARALVREL